jgi:hypothetical protein
MSPMARSFWTAAISGQALAGADLLGPLNQKGLTGWAYEKGISLLAAAEANDPSFEEKKLGAGLLTYALVREGLQQRKADARPLDGRIELEEWLRYAAARVASLASETKGTSGTASADTDAFQQGRFAPARRARPASLVLAASQQEP